MERRDTRLLSVARSVADGATVTRRHDGAEARERELMEALDVVARIRQYAVGESYEAARGDGGAPADAEPSRPGLALGDGTPVPSEWEHVRLIEKVGEGAFGTVFRALDRSLELETALKVVSPEHEWAGRRILEEGRRLARLRHPNVVCVYGVDQLPPFTGLRMEFVRGLTLEELIVEHGRLDERESTRIAIDVCRALGALHAMGIVHRDVKPQNVMLADDGRVVLMDLGAGVASDDTPGQLASFAGTPMYAPPETLHGEAQDERADVYATGVVLYQALTGEYPYEAADIDALLRAFRAGPRPIASVHTELTEACARAVDRAIAIDPDDRYPDAETFARALVQVRTRTRAHASRVAREPSGHPTNLPLASGPFIGRARRVGHALRALAETRLLTLVGPGGAGKTRLGTELGRELLEESPGGVWLTELAPVARPERVVDAMAQALGVEPGPKQAPIDGLVERFGELTALLVLDNCEHVVGACAEVVSTLLARCPGLRVVATSREPLLVEGERVLAVLPLALPAVTSVRLDTARRTESVRLFVGCATGVEASFALTDENVGAVCELCRRLDGIPLALELAAMHVTALSPRAIVQRLDARFQLLRRGRRDAQAHHRTLRALVDWSYERLAPPHRALLRRLSVFAGSMDLDAVEAVGSGATCDADPVDCLVELVEKSLVEATAGDEGTVRYRMLETIRAYARERLEESGERRVAERAFRAHMLELVVKGSKHFRGPGEQRWRAALGPEHDNVLAAFESFTGTDPDLAGATRLLVSIGWLWTSFGHWALLRQLAEELIACPGIEASAPGGHAALYALAADIADHQGDYDAATAYQTRSLEIRRGQNDERGVALALGGLGVTAFNRGEYEAARRYHEESLALHRAHDNLPGVVKSLNNLATVLECQGAYPRARACLTEAIEIGRGLGDEWGVTAALNNLGIVNARVGDIESAATCFGEVLERNRKMGDRWGTALTAHNLGEMRLEQGRLEEARALTGESLGIWSSLDDRRGVAAAFCTAGVLAERRGRLRLCVRLIICSTRLLEEMKASFSEADRRTVDAVLERAGEALGETELAKVTARAAAETHAALVEEALAWLDPEASP